MELCLVAKRRVMVPGGPCLGVPPGIITNSSINWQYFQSQQLVESIHFPQIQAPGLKGSEATLYEDWKSKLPDKEDPDLPT